MAGGYDGETDPLVQALMKSRGPNISAITGAPLQALASALQGGSPQINPAQIAGMNPAVMAAQIRAQGINQQMQNVQASQNRPGNGYGAIANGLAQMLLTKKQMDNAKVLGQAQIGSTQGAAQALFPNDPRGQLAYMLDRDGMSKSIAAQYAPIDVRQGNSLINAPASVAGTQGSPPNTFIAPTFGVNNDRPTMTTAAGMQTLPLNGQQGAALPPGYPEQAALQNANTQQAGQQETARENAYADQFLPQKLAIEAQQANAASTQAGAAAQNSNVGASNSQNFAPPPGYVPYKGP